MRAASRTAGYVNFKSEQRYAVLVCFLWQTYRDTIDHMIDMYHKLMIGVYKRAQTELDEQTRQQRRMIQTSLGAFHTLGEVILDENIPDSELRAALFEKISQEQLTTQMNTVETWLTGKYSHVFYLVMQRFSYLRQFAPILLEHLAFQLEEGTQSTVVTAVHLLRELNQANKRNLPANTPLDFIPKTLRPLVEKNGQVDKRAWECALLTTLRDEIRAGNVFIQQSKRFGRFDDFFISKRRWQAQSAHFFQRAGLPENPADVPSYLTDRLNQAYDQFLKRLPENAYAQVDEGDWQLSTDPADKLDTIGKQRRDVLEAWLSKHLRKIRLPELLIELDNELRFTHPFMGTVQQADREAGQVCAILATLLAHGCNLGPYTMAHN